MICAGIDAGSRTIKVALLRRNDLRILALGVTDQGVRQADLAAKLLKNVLKKGGLQRSNVKKIVATGYGCKAIDFADATITEITCQAQGVSYKMPTARTVVDIGGQDSKILRLKSNGSVHDFVMNDRCAAGTGRFLEIVAARLNVRLAELGKMAEQAEKPAAINNTCVIFAETDIIGLLASSEKAENIIAGVQQAIALRLASMAGSNIMDPVVLTGGVALVPGMAKALQLALGRPVKIVPQAQLTGAIGAAILAAR